MEKEKNQNKKKRRSKTGQPIPPSPAHAAAKQPTASPRARLPLTHRPHLSTPLSRLSLSDDADPLVIVLATTRPQPPHPDGHDATSHASRPRTTSASVPFKSPPETAPFPSAIPRNTAARPIHFPSASPPPDAVLRRIPATTVSPCPHRLLLSLPLSRTHPLDMS